MKNKVIKYIKSKKLISHGDKIVVGVSGGADSMCLFHVLKSIQTKYNLKLVVAHINHGVRSEAKEDAMYVRSICKEWGVPYRQHNCDMAKIAKDKSCSEEEAGRSERYMFFEKVRKGFNANKIATAHTMNDQAETMLMRIIRGSGVTGIGGIRSKRGFIIRPVLILEREEVEKYCKHNNIHYKEDKTNKLDIYTRNKLRLKVLPILKQEFNPNVIENMHILSEQLQQTEDYLELETKKAYNLIVAKYKNGYSLNIEMLLSYHITIQTRIIRMAIENQKGNLKDISYKHIMSVQSLMEKQSGKKVNLPDNIIGIREFGNIRIMKERESIVINKKLSAGVNKITEINKKVTINKRNSVESTQRLRKTYTKNIDYDKISGNLQIRNRKPGDRIVLASGTKKLKDFFIDEKIPKTSRDDILLITDDINIIWIVGYRLSELYYIIDETKNILTMHISNLET